MQSCSVHHCVLFLLTLTLTTDPGSATVFPIYAKLNESVTLPCGAQCSGRAKWSLDYNRDVVFARCDQTSCTSVKDGYEMSYDRYKSGDLSLTITNPDYSLRKTYSCECDYSDYATVNLRISTVFSEVQMSPEGDLKLDLSVPEPVEVIYRGSVLGDGVQICTVTNRTLQCKSEYTPRTSLSNSEITLRHVKPWDSGTYTIRNLDYKEDIRVYAVSVSAVFSAVPVQTVEDLKLDLSVPESVLKLEVIYESRDSADDVQICTVTNRTLQCNDKYTPRTSLSYPELTLRHMMPWDSGTYTIRNLDYKEDIRVYAVSVSGLTGGEKAGIVIAVLILVLLMVVVVFLKWIKPERKRRQVNRDKEPVLKLIIQALNNPVGEMEEVEEKINTLQKTYSGDSQYSGDVVLFCEQMRLVLSLWKNLSRTQMKSLDPGTVEVIRDMIAVDDLIKEIPLRRAGEVWVRLEEVEMKELKQKYRDNSEYEQHVFRFCYIKRSEMDLCRTLYGKGNAVTGEVKRRMVAVNDLMKQVKRSTTGEDVVKAMKKALQETNTLELDYMWSRKYSHHVTKFCTIQRIELDWYITFYAQIRSQQPEKQDNESSEYANVSELGEEDRSLVERVERAMKIFKKLKDEATLKRHNISSEELDEMFNHVERFVSWYETKIMELSRYKEVLPAQAPKAPRNTDGEERKLLAFT